MSKNTYSASRSLNPFSLSNLTLLFLSYLIVSMRDSFGANAEKNVKYSAYGCLEDVKFPSPINASNCNITYTYVDGKWDLSSINNCPGLICPTPTRKPTPHPHPTKPPTHKKIITGGPTPPPTPKPTPEPTPEPTILHTHRPTPRPRRTAKPTRKHTVAPTICMQAVKVPSGYFEEASKSVSTLPGKPGRLLSSATASSVVYKSGVLQRGVGYISFTINGVENRCLATLIARDQITFPADCMLTDYANKGGDIIREITPEWYASFKFYGGLLNDTFGQQTAKYALAFYPEPYADFIANWTQYNAAVVAIDPPLGDVLGWMNATSNNAANNEENQIVNQVRYAGSDSTDPVIDLCCEVTNDVNTGEVKSYCGPNDATAHGGILYSQLATDTAGKYAYDLKAISTGNSNGYNTAISADVVSVLGEFASENVDPAATYETTGLPLVKDKASACKSSSLRLRV